ncbi:MAG: glycosyltransferase family 39 protein, partial [Thermoguttaceae bacterium]
MTAYLLPTHFPDQLAAMHGSDNLSPSTMGDANDGSTMRRRNLTLCLLVLSCLVPRAFMAWKIGGLCPDAVVYIQVAKSFDKGLLHEGTHHRFGLNLYPVVLMLLHRSGLDWELAGKLWNGMISCLTVLPLYGWVRRQFDDRVALTAGFLYAMHSELIRSSPEGIRDPTFWFFMVLSLYLLWRAITEVRLSLFLFGGLGVAMAAMTRSEGWFLIVPLVLWSYWRGRASAEIVLGTPRETSAMRRKLVLGVMLAVGVFPSLLVLASLFWFRENAPWELVRTNPLRFVELWIHAGLTRLSGHDATVLATSGVGWIQMVGLFSSALLKGMTPAFT